MATKSKSYQNFPQEELAIGRISYWVAIMATPWLRITKCAPVPAPRVLMLFQNLTYMYIILALVAISLHKILRFPLQC